MKKGKIIKALLKIVIFVVIFSVLFTSTLSVLFVGVDRMSYNSVQSFYEEPENSVDAVYIGSSNVLAFWNPLLAWQEYGIKIPTLACNSGPVSSLEFLLKEAQKTQPNAVFVMNINTLGEKEVMTLPRFHKVFSYSPLSLNKIQSIERMGDFYDLTVEDKMELYCPMIRFHSRWDTITNKDFDFKTNGYKGAIASPNYLKTYKNVSKGYGYCEDYADLSDMLDRSVTSLLDYCDTQDFEVLFVTVPQSKDSDNLSKYNSINKMITDRGYKTLDLMYKTDELNIDPKKDFYNSDHTNIHGSAKFTHYMADYFIENYGFENKRSKKSNDSWETGLKDYRKKIDTSIMDFEMKPGYTPSILNEPENLTATVENDTTIKLSWYQVEGADGYAVYEKAGKKGIWAKIAETEALDYIDKDFFGFEEKYFYRIVPFKTVDGNKSYGDFSYEAVEAIINLP